MSGITTSAVGALHGKLVLGRRASVLAGWFAELAPEGARILDVGCGDGMLSARLMSLRPDLSIDGVDVLVREGTHIPVREFDGSILPFHDESYDAVLFSDVLHHTPDPMVLQREAHRVARGHVLIKDHFVKGVAAATRLRLMDWVGNARFGVSLPYNYWTEEQWHDAWTRIGLRPERIVTRLGLYPKPLNSITGAQLHFVARLAKAGDGLSALHPPS
ncbi:MAG: methyltransferase type 11 [Gemmatimonadetes bacterium]|nr:methyltransferase type 11 [Gemmatimonadota bacterium]